MSAEQFLSASLEAHPPPEGPLCCISLGKAAGSMAKAIEQSCGERLASGFAASHDSLALGGLSAKWELKVGSHPRPNQDSIEAGESLVNWIHCLPPDAQVIACLSGGASAILELPRPPHTLQDIQNCLDQSFSQGWAIEKLNQERSRLSALKGGGLAKLLGPKLKAVYCLSDVEPGRLDVLGSGPFWTDETAHLHHLAADRSWVKPVVESACVRAGLIPSHQGSLSTDLSTWLEGSLRKAVQSAEPGTAHFWLGELTIKLGENPPPGGRCHEAAAWAATLLRPCQALAAFGTDGLDGTSGGSGACAASNPSLEFPSQKALLSHQTLEWCKAVGASLPPFFTGSNLNDVVVLITQ